jgi:hypothetical protein
VVSGCRWEKRKDEEGVGGELIDCTSIMLFFSFFKTLVDHEVSIRRKHVWMARD